MPERIESPEWKEPVWNEFRWYVLGQWIHGVYTELTEVENSVQKIRVAVEIPSSVENVQINLINRKRVDRRFDIHILEDECYTVSYWDSYLKTGRLIVLPRELLMPGEDDNSKKILQIEELQVYGQDKKGNLY